MSENIQGAFTSKQTKFNTVKAVYELNSIYAVEINNKCFTINIFFKAKNSDSFSFSTWSSLYDFYIKFLELLNNKRTRYLCVYEAVSNKDLTIEETILKCDSLTNVLKQINYETNTA